ncbi:MAG: hypothetical protein ABEJ94_08180 [Halorientalis sp.]
MGIGRTIGNLIGSRMEEQKRTELEDQLDSFGLSREDIESVEPYIDYIVERRGKHKPPIWAAIGFLVLGAVIAIAANFLFIMVPMVFFSLLTLLLSVYAYYRHRKAMKVQRALLSNPETFANDEPHEFHHIGN